MSESKRKKFISELQSKNTKKLFSPVDGEGNLRRRSFGEEMTYYFGMDDASSAAFLEAERMPVPNNMRAEKSFGGGPADAYRHILITAEMTRRAAHFGVGFGAAHEIIGLMKTKFNDNEGQYPEERKNSDMDFYNNAIGAEIGAKAKTWEDIVRMAREKISEAAKTDGDGREGRAYWINKVEQPFEPEWAQDIVPTDKNEEKYRYDNWKLKEVPDTLGADEERQKFQSMDFETAEEYEQYRAQQSGFNIEQKKAAPAVEPADASPAPHGAAGDTQQAPAQQFAASTGLDGNNGRNYAAELAALPPGREVSLNWLLQKDPSHWSQQELDDAQASNAYWNGRNPRHGEVQGAVTDVYSYLYGDGSQSFRPDGSLPRAEPINTLRGDGMPAPEWQRQRQARLADIGVLMEDFPPVDGSEAARVTPARFLQQAINEILWPGQAKTGQAGPDAASIQSRPYRNGPILVDGEIGPITAQALDRVEALPDGLSKLTHSLKRQAAQDIVQRVEPDMPGQELAHQLDQAVNIFRDMNRTHESSVRHLQKGLNRLGQDATGLNETWQPIAEDGQLGPVTARSFATLAKRLPVDSMVGLFDFGPAPKQRASRAASQMPALSARDPNPRQRMRAGML